jgi:hypothetical protein
MTDADLAIISNRSGNTERLKPFAKSLGDIGGIFLSLLNCSSGADKICPSGVLLPIEVLHL